MKTISVCEVCGSGNLRSALDLGHQPMCDDLVPIGSTIEPKKYKLEILGCETCFTFHQKYQIDKSLLFPSTYHYRARFTQDVLMGMRDLVDNVEQHVGNLKDLQVLDIGCNDGSLLKFFKHKGAKTFGIEPTNAFHDAVANIDDGLNLYFGDDAVDAYLANYRKPDIITFTNVFAHIENLTELLAQLKRLMHDKTLLVIENHYLGAVSKLSQFDTFYHEHPRTYSINSFRFIASALDRKIEHVSFPERYNGNIRIMLGNGGQCSLDWLNERQDYERLFRIQHDIEYFKPLLSDKLFSLVGKYGTLPAKAFPGRACISVNFFGINENIVDATYERTGSPKIGHYVPGTKIEIRDEKEFFDERVNSPILINFAWHISAEIQRYVRKHGFKGDLVDAWLPR